MRMLNTALAAMFAAVVIGVLAVVTGSREAFMICVTLVAASGITVYIEDKLEQRRRIRRQLRAIALRHTRS